MYEQPHHELLYFITSTICKQASNQLHLIINWQVDSSCNICAQTNIKTGQCLYNLHSFTT